MLGVVKKKLKSWILFCEFSKDIPHLSAVDLKLLVDLINLLINSSNVFSSDVEKQWILQEMFHALSI